MDTIYVYSTPSYRAKDWYKIGFTSRNATIRVKEQDGTSNPEALELLAEWSSQGKHDTDFHTFLEKRSIYQTRDNREWFEVPGGVPVIQTLWNDFIFGISRPDSYEMRPEQMECCEQAVRTFRDGSTKFLINAKPRFGKTFTTYQIIKKMGYKNVLILSYKPQVFDSWRGDLENHVDFHNWSGSKATDGMPDSETNIVFESFQQLLSKNGLKKNPKTKWIYGHKWDLVVLDEEHYGTKTENAGKVFSALKRGYKLLKLSGTPYKTILNGEFNEEQIFNWTYVDEQKCKNSGSSHHQNMPTMRFNTFKVHPDIVKMAEELGYVEEDGFRIEKVFAAQAEGFENPNLVSKFLDTFSSQSRKGQSWSPLYAKKGIDPKMLDHMLWVMPQSVDSVRAICKMLDNHPGFDDYDIINASGSDGVSDIQDVKKAIRRHNKTITVTCGRFDTGVTVPEWKSVVMLDGSKSPEKYIQTIFRVQNPLDGYSECVVIDFNPQRLLEMTYDWCAVASKKSQSTIDAIREFFEVASIIEHGENGIVEKDLNGVMSAFNASGGWRDRFASRVGLRVSLADPKVLTGLLGIKIANAKKITEIVSDSEMEEGKISKTLTKAQEKKRKDEIKKIAEQAKQVLRRIPTYLVSETKDLADTSQMLDEGNVNTFKVITGVHMEWFRHSLDVGFLDRSHIDRCISDLGHSLGQINYETFLTETA